MKTYQQVVKERYNRLDQEDINKNIYSLINPIGFYGMQKIQKVFYDVFNVLKKEDFNLNNIKILDLGCGSGQWCRFFAEIIQDPTRVTGVDLSSVRIKKAKEMNSEIKYSCQDIVKLSNLNRKWDLVVAMDVFMHLNNEKQIITALKNINKILKDKGYFIFYDAYSEDHFISKKDADSTGFNPQQIEIFCQKIGFQKKLQINLFKKIFGKFHSVYLYRKFSKWSVNLAEKILPGQPGNILIVFEKRINS